MGVELLDERRRGRGIPATLTGDDRDLVEEGAGRKSGRDDRKEAVAERPAKRWKSGSKSDAGVAHVAEGSGYVQATRKRRISRSETTEDSKVEVWEMSKSVSARAEWEGRDARGETRRRTTEGLERAADMATDEGM